MNLYKFERGLSQDTLLGKLLICSWLAFSGKSTSTFRMDLISYSNANVVEFSSAEDELKLQLLKQKKKEPTTEY